MSDSQDIQEGFEPASLGHIYRKNGEAGPFGEWLAEYDDNILPMRTKADEGEGSYGEYDEAYNEHLEALHDLVRDDAALLDAAPELEKFVHMIARMTTGEEQHNSEDARFDLIEHGNAFDRLILEARKLLNT